MNTLAQSLGGIVALVIVVLVLILAVFWLLFPMLMHRQLSELIRLQRDANKFLAAIQLGLTPTQSAPTPRKPDLVHCKCTHCSQHISYDRSEFSPGQTITCPGCGLDTQLYSPPALAGMAR